MKKIALFFILILQSNILFCMEQALHIDGAWEQIGKHWQINLTLPDAEKYLPRKEKCFKTELDSLTETINAIDHDSKRNKIALKLNPSLFTHKESTSKFDAILEKIKLSHCNYFSHLPPEIIKIIIEKLIPTHIENSEDIVTTLKTIAMAITLLKNDHKTISYPICLPSSFYAKRVSATFLTKEIKLFKVLIENGMNINGSLLYTFSDLYNATIILRNWQHRS